MTTSINKTKTHIFVGLPDWLPFPEDIEGILKNAEHVRQFTGTYPLLRVQYFSEIDYLGAGDNAMLLDTDHRLLSQPFVVHYKYEWSPTLQITSIDKLADPAGLTILADELNALGNAVAEWVFSRTRSSPVEWKYHRREVITL